MKIISLALVMRVMIEKVFQCSLMHFIDFSTFKFILTRSKYLKGGVMNIYGP